MNVHCNDEPTSTDTIYSETPVIDDGSTCAQLIVVTKSLVLDIYGMITNNQFSSFFKIEYFHRDKLVN